MMIAQGREEGPVEGCVGAEKETEVIDYSHGTDRRTKNAPDGQER